MEITPEISKKFDEYRNKSKHQRYLAMKRILKEAKEAQDGKQGSKH